MYTENKDIKIRKGLIKDKHGEGKKRNTREKGQWKREKQREERKGKASLEREKYKRKYGEIKLAE